MVGKMEISSLLCPELEKNIKNPYVTYDDKGNGYLNECSAQTCCHRNYTCGEYYSASYTVKCKKCNSVKNRIISR